MYYKNDGVMEAVLSYEDTLAGKLGMKNNFVLEDSVIENISRLLGMEIYVVCIVMGCL